jgi:hypothetical protein
MIWLNARAVGFFVGYNLRFLGLLYHALAAPFHTHRALRLGKLQFHR